MNNTYQAFKSAHAAAIGKYLCLSREGEWLASAEPLADVRWQSNQPVDTSLQSYEFILHQGYAR